MIYNALEFLERLFIQPTGDTAEDPLPVVAPTIFPADLPVEWHVLWDERAAIMEYCGGLHREHAEAEALRDILQQMERAGLIRE